MTLSLPSGHLPARTLRLREGANGFRSEVAVLLSPQESNWLGLAARWRRFLSRALVPAAASPVDVEVSVAKLFVLKRMRVFSQLGLLAMGLAAVVAACASSGKSSGGGFSSSGGSGSGSGSGSTGGGDCITCSGNGGGNTTPGVGVVAQSTCTSAAKCSDFSSAAGVTCANGDCVNVDSTGPTPVPSNPASLFANPSTSGGPCLVEPQDGTMFPNGWTRPRISWAPAASSQNVFQVRIHSDSEDADLVVYTSNTNITLPAALWKTLSTSLVGPAVSVTVTAASASGGSAASSPTASFTISSVPALGALIYWTTESFDNNATNTQLKGFHVGDEGTTVALTSSQVLQPVDAVPVDGGNITKGKVGVYCIGCHTSTPDGNYVAFTAQWPWPNALASVNSTDAGVAVGMPPPWLTGGAAANLSPLTGPASANGVTFYSPPVVNQVMLGVQTFSPSHYQTGDRKVVSALGASQNSLSITAANTFTGVISQLAWFDLEWAGTASTSGFATAPCGTNPGPPGACYPVEPSNGGWGIIARNGDTQSAGAPSWSHNLDGKTDLIAYTSSDNGTKDGRLDMPGTGGADIFTVPYNAGAGGTATAVAGASDPAFNEYYPSWAPDDSLIAFNRVAAGNSMYNQPKAEVDVVESPNNVSCDGTTSGQCRLKANDPVACTGSVSPGVQNTWPKWAPLPNIESNGSAPNKGSDGKLYYYLTFSSTRATACTVTATSGATNTLCTAAQSTAAVGRAQLYVTVVSVDPNNKNAITTYPAVYMWNQDAALNNLIPAWDYFPIAVGNAPPLQ
jgi:hypothetical protein